MIDLKQWKEFDEKYSIERTIAMEKKFEVVKYLIKNGADVNIKDNDGKTALDLARTNNKCDEIEFLINAANADWQKQLFISISKGDLDKVEQCLTNGADINARDNDGKTALDLAKTNKLGQQFIDEIEFLINPANADWQKQLFISISKGDLDKVKQCLANGADINVKSNEGYTALISALNSFEDNWEIVKFLVKSGADINVKDNNGRTALIYASSKDFYASKYLIDNGADINAKDNNGWTALMQATYHKKLEVVKLLIQNGVDMNAQGSCNFIFYNGTALMIALREGHLDILKYLIESGADVNIRYSINILDNFGWTALIYASSGGYLEIVKCLVENGADINAKSNSGYTALMSASNNGHLEIVKYLIFKDVDINAKDNDGKTALDYAKANSGEFLNSFINDIDYDLDWEESDEWIKMQKTETLLSAANTGWNNQLSVYIKLGDLDVIKWCLKKGADINNKDGGYTPLMEASQCGHLEVVKYLVEKGADINAKSFLYEETALDLAKTDEIALFLMDVANRNRGYV